MGRQPSAGSVDESAGSDRAAGSSVTTGAHCPATFARLVLEKVGAGDSGVLEVAHDGHHRLVYIVGGRIVAALSDLPDEDLAATLVNSGRLEASRVEWMKEHCGPDEPLVEALLAAGSIHQADLDAHLVDHLTGLVGASLSWSSGEWTWTDAGPEATARFEPTLLPNVDTLAALIHGVETAFETAALWTFVQETNAGAYVADPRLNGSSIPAWLPTELHELPERLASGAEPASLAEALDMDPDRLSPILWLLEATGLVHRRNPPAALVPTAEVATILPAAPTSPKKVKGRKAQETPPSDAAARPVVSETPTRELPAPRAALSPKATAKRVKKKAPSKKTVPKATFPRAQELLDAEDYDGAYALLGQLRNDHPSCPDILAALGWAGWRSGNYGTNAYDSPDDFLLLALTFDPAHHKALEYFARMAMDQGDVETARNRLLQLLQVKPEADWARSALEEGALATKSKSGGLGLRFWPKGKA